VEFIARCFSTSDLNCEEIPINAHSLYVYRYVIADEAKATETIKDFSYEQRLVTSGG
jgi:hypothetical protein